MWTLAIVGAAFGWAPDAPYETVLPGTIAAVSPVGVGGGVAVAAVGPEGLWLVDPARGVIGTRPVPGVGVIERTDGGTTTLWVCDATGVRRVGVTDAGLGEPELVLGEPCRAIAEQPDAIVIAGAAGVRRYPLERGRLGLAQELGPLGPGRALLAADAERVVYTFAGGSTVDEWSSFGRSTLAAGGPVSALSTGPAGPAWALADTGTLGTPSHRTVVLAPGPVAVTPATLDGVAAWVVVHDGRIGLVTGEEERLLLGPANAAAAVASDLDLDGCVDLVVAGGPKLVALYGVCPTAAPGATTMQARTVSGTMSNGPIPNASGTRAAGQTLPPSTSPVDPSVAAPERAPTERPGFEKAGIAVPILLGGSPVVTTHAGEAMRLRLVHPRNKSGITFLSRGGPPGLIVYRDGLVEYLPTASDVGRWTVLVTMIDGLFSRTERLGIVVLPAREGGGSAEVAVLPEGPAVAPKPAPDAHRAVCLLGAGVAAGGSYVGSSWDRIGQPAFAASASPAASLACDLSDHPTRWFLGLDTAPMFKYAVGDSNLVHFAAASTGVMFGGPKFRAGPYGTVGLLVLGAGVRAVWTPIGDEDTPYRGLELRITGYVPSSPAGQVMVLFTAEVG